MYTLRSRRLYPLVLFHLCFRDLYIGIQMPKLFMTRYQYEPEVPQKFSLFTIDNLAHRTFTESSPQTLIWGFSLSLRQLLSLVFTIPNS